ncbi:nitroreductase family protein [Nanoarchaeota archaeon]
MQLDQAIQSRKSVRKFSKKKPDWRDIIECIDSCRYAPMAGNIFTLKFILVSDSKTIQKLADAAQQDFIAQSQYVVVVCSNPKLTENAYANFSETFLRQQAGAAIQNFLLKIQEKNLATCWVGYFIEDQVKKALKIPNTIKVEAFFPISNISKEKGTAQRQKQKIDLDSILYFEEYKNKKMNPPKKMNV